MKRLVTMAACLAMLTFTGCANGILGGGISGSSCNNGCNSSSTFSSNIPTFGGGSSLFSDGPIRQFFRGDACDSCNSAAGQVSPGFIPSDPFANPSNVPFGNSFSQPVITQPSTSFFPGDNGVSLGQPLAQPLPLGQPLEQPVISGGSQTRIDPGSILGTPSAFGPIDGGLSEPPFGSN